MSAPIIPLKEFDTEMTNTRKLLARVPADKIEWKPHEKSFPLGHLAQLISGMPSWITMTLRDPSLDLAASGFRYGFEPPSALLESFDKNVGAARSALAEVSGAALEEPWSLKMGPQTLFTRPRGEVVREHLSHLVHHRGQLTVYLRLLDVPLSQVYGPTADERGMPS